MMKEVVEEVTDDGYVGFDLKLSANVKNMRESGGATKIGPSAI